MAWTKLYQKFWDMIRRQHHFFLMVVEQQDLYPGQPHLLYHLNCKKGISQGKLAEKIFVSPSTLATMLNRMEKKGLIIRVPDAHDRRVKNVFLSPDGLVKRKRFDTFMKGVNLGYFKDFSKEEEEVLTLLIEKLIHNMDTMEGIFKEAPC